MLEPKRKPGPPKTGGPYATNAGISLYPRETELLDQLKERLGKESRGDVVRWFLDQHSYAFDDPNEVSAA